SQDEMDLFVIGDMKEKEVQKLVEQVFPFPEGQGAVSAEESLGAQGHDGKVVIDEEDIVQGKLNLGYRTKTTYEDDGYFSLVVLNGIFGGFPHSKLFT